MTTEVAQPELDSHLGGHYAGFVTRLGAFLIDVLAIGIIFALGSQVTEYLLGLLTGHDFHMANAARASAIAFVIWVFVYCVYPLKAAGRTLGMAVLGTRAVRIDGSPLRTWQAVVRVLTFPLSFLLFGLGLLLIVLRRDRRALHDLFSRTAVIYDWDARAARLQFLRPR